MQLCDPALPRSPRGLGLAKLGCWLALSLPASASAAGLSTAALSQMCGKQEPTSQLACQFYVLGAAEGAEISWMSGQRRALFCIPDGSSTGTMATAFLRHAQATMADRPEAGGVSAVATVLAALEKSFPCSEVSQSVSAVSGGH